MNQKDLLENINSKSKNTLMEVLDIKFINIAEDAVTASMPVTSKVHQPLGQLHGGASAVLAETVASVASMLTIDSKEYFVNGVELSINHIKSKREGMVFATAKNIHKGRSTQLWEVRIVDEQDQLIALSKMTSVILKKK